MAGLLDFAKPKTAAPTGDPTTAVERLQKIYRSRDWLIADEKTKGRPKGTPADLTPAQRKALDDEARDRRILAVGEPVREDRDYAGNPKSPGLPPKSTEPRGYDWSIAVARERDPFIQKSLAAQTISAIMTREHPASKAYWDASHPEHDNVAKNVLSLREILNAKPQTE